MSKRGSSERRLWTGSTRTWARESLLWGWRTWLRTSRTGWGTPIMMMMTMMVVVIMMIVWGPQGRGKDGQLCLSPTNTSSQVRLLALLEVLSGERLPMERGRVLRRPHYLSNCNTALEFLRSKRVRTTFFVSSCKFLSRHAVSASEPFVNTNCSRRVINKTWPKETRINEFQP